MDETIPTDAELWRQSERLRALARALVADAGLGEDLAQEAWVAALGRPGAAAESVAGWLSGTVRHLARRLGQRERQRVEVEQRAARAEAVEGPEEAVLRAEALQELGRAVLALDEPYRSAVILRHLEQLEPGEIARRQGCSREAARQRVARGLAELRRRLDRDHGGRERWCRALVPLARPLDGSGIVVGAGGVLMAKWSVAAIMALFMLILLWLRRGHGTEAEPAVSTVEMGEQERSVRPPMAQEDAAHAKREELLVQPENGVPAKITSEAALLRGRVVGPGGAPVADARVALHRPELRGYACLDLTLDPQGELWAETKTDPMGGFEFELPAGLVVDVWAEKGDVGEALSVERFAGQSLVLMLHEAFLVRGRVTREHDGLPVVDALVSAFQTSGHGHTLRRKTHTDAEGRYELRLPVGEGVQLDVLPLHEQARSNLRVQFDELGEAHLDVAVVEGLTVEGIVTDARTGRPIAGALIGESWTMRRTTRSDAAGRYRFTGFGAAGVHDLRARAEGYAEKVDYPDARRTPIPRLDFALDTARMAHGSIVDPKGSPLAGAYVAAIGQGAPAEVDWAVGRSDTEGRFRCPGLSPEMRHTLLVYHPGFASVYYDFPGLELFSTELDLGVIQLTPPGLVQGRVLDSEGNPVSGARVELVGKNDDRRRLCGEDSPTEELANWYTDERQTIGDEGGHFLFGGIAPGHYSLSAMAEGRAWTTPLEFQLETAGERKEVEIVFLDGGTLLGRVQDERGLPVAGVSVHVRLEPVTMTGFSTDVRSEADGTFEVRGLTAGRSYSLEVFPWLTASEDPCTPWLYSSLEGASPDTGVAVVTLHRGVCIDGRIFDAAGQPQHGLSIALENAQGEPGLGTLTDSEGRFLLGVEPNTTWTLTVSGPKEEASFALLSVERNVPSGTRDLVLRLPR